MGSILQEDFINTPGCGTFIDNDGTIKWENPEFGLEQLRKETSSCKTLWWSENHPYCIIARLRRTGEIDLYAYQGRAKRALRKDVSPANVAEEVESFRNECWGPDVDEDKKEGPRAFAALIHYSENPEISRRRQYQCEACGHITLKGGR